MALLTVQRPTLAGTALTYAAVSGSDTFANTGRTYIHVKNGGASPSTVTIKADTNFCNFAHAGSGHDLVDTVTNGQDKIIGPFDASRFNNSSGIVNVQFSYTTSVTIAVLE